MVHFFKTILWFDDFIVKHVAKLKSTPDCQKREKKITTVFKTGCNFRKLQK